ncbi:hypothetical protein VB711_16210 [Cronbergia sp. UHCC 0137]|uniref:hypothetical protein n=1 Tax=Cronbergia sp. UHCC 0137 TaxID=3110239 RepID=UPI002B1EC07B|nr:hypothetical protein [Cronbergia sp. UHCC 0137]MEA5619373.1 hypothetical protein [Cronbergia sp. UHCC 0137]
MTKLKFPAIVRLNWVRFIGTTLLSSLLITTAVSVASASTKDKTNLSNQEIELGADINSQVSASPNHYPSSHNNVSVSQPKQPQLIAQRDSSNFVGDSLGESNKLRQELLIDPIIQEADKAAAAPGSSAGTPTAYGASQGQAFIGVAGFIPLDGDNADASFGLGFGLGDPIKSVGVEIAADIISSGLGSATGDSDKSFLEDFGEDGTVGFKVHKILPDGTAVAFGWANPIKWGDASVKDTFYGVVTRSYRELTVSGGIGTGSFASKGAQQANENAVNVFGSLGYRVAPEAALVSSWTGSGLNLGASFAPFKQVPVVINTVFTDVTDNLDEGVGFSLTAGYSLRF